MLRGCLHEILFRASLNIFSNVSGQSLVMKNEIRMKYENPQNETHCECCFIAVILTIKISFRVIKWDKVFKNGPSKICGRQSLKNLNRPYPLKFFKGCLPQILLGPVLNTLS